MIKYAEEQYGRFYDDIMYYGCVPDKLILEWYPFDRDSIAYRLRDGYVIKYDSHKTKWYKFDHKDDKLQLDYHIGDILYDPKNVDNYERWIDDLYINTYYDKERWKERFIEHYNDINETLKFTKTYIYENTGLSLVSMTNYLNCYRERYDVSDRKHSIYVATYKQSIPSLYNATKMATAMRLPLSRFAVPTSSVVDIYKLRMCKEWNCIIDKLKRLYPHIMEDVDKWQPVGTDEIMVILYDGTRFTFDLRDYSKTITFDPLIKPGDFISECDWRKEFGKRLYFSIRKSGFKHKDVYEKVGVTQSMFSNYVNGNKTPSLYIATKIARVLDCSLTEFHII